MRRMGLNILIFPGFAPCGAQARPVRERQTESAPMAKSTSKPKAKLASKPNKGKAGEQSTMFFLDPSGNALEFKAFADDAMVFAK